MRRYVTSLASVALAILLTSGVALFASEVASAATNTFSNSTQITIPDRGAATPYPSAISVSSLGTVTDVDLKLNGFSHTSPYDMEVELVGPSGPSIMMMADAGGSYDVSNIDVTLDDEAATGLPTWSQLSTGSHRPTSPLSAFDGTNPNGVWELYVHNAWEKGSISGGWSVTITSSDDPPPLDTSPPDTTLREKPSPFTSNVNPKFSFRSSEGGSTFTCKLDDGAYQTCTAPKSYFLVSEGQHTFAVKAKDAANNFDPSPAEYTWTVDSLDPKVTFTERPGRFVGWGDWVTNDMSPAWAWTVQDPNLVLGSDECSLYDDTNNRYILDYIPCSSPLSLEGNLPDGDYHFGVSAEDKAYNYGYGSQYLEVDTAAPKFVSRKPTGTSVGRYADVVVVFDDVVYNSKQFVNFYRKGSTTPMVVYRFYGHDDKRIVLAPKNGFRPDTWYKVKVTTGVNDGANNLEVAKTWSFKTAG